MARTATLRATGASFNISVSVAPTSARRARKSRDWDSMLAYRIRRICALSEAYMVAPSERILAQLAYQERELACMGLTRADIFSWVNRSPVPGSDYF